VYSTVPEVAHGNLVGDFYSEVRIEDILKPTIGNKSLHESSNGNGVRDVTLLFHKF
jgi:hypothetical protein